jgi:hypothetical protein
MTDHTFDDGLDALDFSGGTEANDADDAFDFAAPSDQGDETDADAIGDYAPPATESDHSDLDAVSADADDEATERDELDDFTTTVTNPSETVSVSALIDGSIRRVELSPKATDMTEAQLTDEILVLAHLAQQKGLAGQRSYLMENDAVMASMRELGLDGQDVVRDMTDGMGLPTAGQADAERAEVFAARYSTGHD